jgi:hypothetical protein
MRRLISSSKITTVHTYAGYHKGDLVHLNSAGTFIIESIDSDTQFSIRLRLTWWEQFLLMHYLDFRKAFS